jgi:hypothetical protein
VEFFRALAAAYLIGTLSATALAKLKNWRATSVGLLREGVIPGRVAVAVTIAVAAAECLLATGFMLGTDPEVTGFAAPGLFVAFCGDLALLAIAAWAAPVVVFLAGLLRHSAPLEIDSRFPVEFASHKYDLSRSVTSASLIRGMPCRSHPIRGPSSRELIRVRRIRRVHRSGARRGRPFGLGSECWCGGGQDGLVVVCAVSL